MRQCLGCREMKPKRELLRVVRSPEGEVSLDTRGKKPGRGAYVCPNADCLKKSHQDQGRSPPARWRRRYRKRSCSASRRNWRKVKTDRALNYLGLMRAAGRIEIGEENTHAAVRHGSARAVLLAADASENARRRAEGFLIGRRALLVRCHIRSSSFRKSSARADARWPPVRTSG